VGLSLSDVLSLCQADKSMKGSIRTRQRCPICKGAFKHIHKVGFICPEHPTKPERFFIDLGWHGKRLQIFSDKDGQPLDSYQRTQNLLAKINYEIDHHYFDLSRYLKAEIQRFWVTTLLDRYLTSKKGKIAPSYRAHYRKMIERERDFFQTHDVRELHAIDLMNYGDWLEKKVSPAPKTLKNHMDHFRAFLGWCKKFEIIRDIPAPPEIRIPERTFRWIGQKDQVKLFEHVPDLDKPVIAFLMLHGCRPGEGRADSVK
jgi:hypothetical protein